jgi:hypothetical protein
MFLILTLVVLQIFILQYKSNQFICIFRINTAECLPDIILFLYLILYYNSNLAEACDLVIIN